MQFITTGNRIAVENFVLGDLYTITFTNGTYINSACIGIGDNFVTFQRNEPELLFTLNMETAELVSSIELYSGGTGTNSYNDLTNKPQINDVELVGNKSLSDLGIQPTISDLDTIRSGAAAGATAVQPAALADYQPIISDLDTIRSGAAAGATAVQPAALADYQPKIDSSHKLDADLVDDTSSTHKFATAALLEQIGINENNILLIEQMNGAKNLFDFANINYTAARCTVSKNSNDLTITNTGDYAYCYFINPMQAGQYVFSCRITDRSGDSTTRISLRKGSTSGAELGGQTFTANGDISIAFTLSADDNVYILYYAADGMQVNTTTYKASNNMIITKDAYDAGFTDYQPYAMSNVELTAAIQAIQAQLAGQ